MSKLIILKLSIITFFIATAFASNLNAQTTPSEIFNGIESDSIFTWKLVEVANPSSQSTFQLIPSSGITVVSWNFGDSNTSTETSPTHTYSYSNWDDSITVTLSYTLSGANLNHSRKLPLSPAYFWILPDDNVGRIATYNTRFISNFKLDNTTTDIGNLRFEWSIDGVVLTGYSFDPTTYGQWPNIYYIFENGGDHLIKLTVYNTSNTANKAEFTHPLHISPEFTTTKEKLVNIPNVFTPNGDGINDEFIVQTSGTSRFVLRIISRSGGLLYEDESNYIRWDGRNSQGNALPAGIYYYIIEDLTAQYESATGFVYIYKEKK
ncbi:MAG: gliding motility-associated C-terminal domain-containing protein [Bacteroidales bacterium]